VEALSLEITWNDVKEKDKETYVLVDIREYEHSVLGMVPGAVAISFIEDVNKLFTLPKEKNIYVYCHKGELSVQAQELLQDAGYKAYSIKGGYYAYLETMLKD